MLQPGGLRGRNGPFTSSGLQGCRTSPVFLFTLALNVFYRPGRDAILFPMTTAPCSSDFSALSPGRRPAWSDLVAPIHAGLRRLRRAVSCRLVRALRPSVRGAGLVRSALVAAAMLLAVVPASAKMARYSAPGGVALSGYDAVAYVNDGRAVQGQRLYALHWRGAVWQFASAANMQAFEQDPMTFAPQFGGYCIESIIDGAPRPADPQIFFLHEGRLYMGSSMATRLLWAQDADALIERARARWRMIRAN